MQTQKLTCLYMQTHTKTHYEISQFACVGIFLIKFHLLELEFHHPITGREAEATIQYWFHQAPGENQSMPTYPLLVLSHHLSFLASFLHTPPPSNHDFTSSLPSLGPLIPSPSPSSCSHPSPRIVERCKTYYLSQQNENSPERRLQYPRHSTMTEHHWPTASYGLYSTCKKHKTV